MTPRMRKHLEEREQAQQALREGGGLKRIQKHHQAGKFTAWERVQMLFDPGTFVETGKFMEQRQGGLVQEGTAIPGEGVITGHGLVDGRMAYIYAQDFTVIGGSIGEMHALKACRAMDYALKCGVPMVALNDSGGARIQEGVPALDGVGQTFMRNTRASGVIPQISVIMGPCAGGAVYSPALTDFVFMVDRTSHMFITGPQVIKVTTGEEIDSEALGGAATHNEKSGVAHFFCDSEKDALAKVKTLLGYLPSNNASPPPWRDLGDDPARAEESLRDSVPEDRDEDYDVIPVLDAVLDRGSLFQVHQRYGRSVITGFGRLDGHVVAVVSSQPLAGSGFLDRDACDKAARFMRFADAFGIPLVTFVDTPGFLPSLEEERGGLARHAAKMFYAYAEATVPKVGVLLRKAHGTAPLALAGKSMGADVVLAWPTAEVSLISPEGASSILLHEDIVSAPDPIASRQEGVQRYAREEASPYRAAARGLVDDVIDPKHTRWHLISALRGLEGKREMRPPKKHGNLPA
ncbi:MAG: acyl-CoA carboxylase subunit beta [Bacillota bacterium]